MSYRTRTGGRAFAVDVEGSLDQTTASPTKPDMTWLGALSANAQQAFQFISAFCYGKQWDAVIRNGLRYSQKIDEVLTHADIEPEWKKVITLQDTIAAGDPAEEKATEEDEAGVLALV